MSAGPTTKPARRTVQIPIDQHHVLRVAAARRDMSMGGLVADWIDREFASEVANEPPKRKKKAKA